MIIRSENKEKYCVGKELQSLALCGFMRKEAVDIDILMASKNGDRKIMQIIRRVRRTLISIRNGNYYSKFR